MSFGASVREFVKPGPATADKDMGWPGSIWFFVRSGPTGIFWPLGTLVIAAAIRPPHVGNLVAGLFLATTGTGAYAGIARSIRLLRGEIGLAVYRDQLRLQTENPRAARFMIRALLPLSVMLAAFWIVVMLVIFGAVSGLEQTTESVLGILEFVLMGAVVGCFAAFALALPFVFTMGFWGRPRFLMPLDYRDRGEAKLRLIAGQPDVWTDEDYANPDTDLTPEELADFKVRQQAAEQRHAQRVRAFEAGLPINQGAGDQARRAEFGLPRDHD